MCPLLVDQVIGEPRYADGLQPLGSKRARTGSTDGNDAAPMDTESVSPAADADALRTVLDLEPESRPVDVCKIGERGGGKLTFEGCKIGERGGGKLTCGGRRPGASAQITLHYVTYIQPSRTRYKCSGNSLLLEKRKRAHIIIIKGVCRRSSREQAKRR